MPTDCRTTPHQATSGLHGIRISGQAQPVSTEGATSFNKSGYQSVPAADCQDLDGLALTLDQRGGPRPINGACDAGAVESGANHLFSDRFEG